ncbi:CPBP family intramembrane glutamic endopeptidase [Paenibacillus sp. MMS20-IR301]|uniref:CPBP family intramembrane glutamic endopeptidase n=1 Tax=Paenibacillus sp. MMS20-IR301 TaxID=2895946 RepID=UPI0028E2EF32|nr:CPBP family intramembrane glutamic endopeptidase [Paenibacillus sp. MMS20-IR301]WNS45565.1 CPBP family intramembrane glutamic endopeptidase [Paenibacillus sp. MMS20-IR301]
MDRLSKRNLILFSFAVLASGWMGVLLDRVLKDQPEGDTLGMGLWLILPLLAVLLLRSFAGDGWKDTGIRPRLRGNLRWYLAALFAFPLVTVSVLLIGCLLGWIDMSNYRTMPSFTGVFLGLLLGQFIKNIFEEAVWRGYLTSKLVQLRLKDWLVYGISGFIWGGWHIPYYLVFLPSSDLYTVLPVDKVTFAAVAIVNMICWSVLFVELFRVTGSIWPCIIMHSVEDALINPLVIDGYIMVAPGKEWLISPIAGILTSLLYVGAGLMVRFIRTRQALS